MHKSKSYFLINLGEKWTLTDNGKEGSGQTLRIIRKIRRNRLVVTSATTARSLRIDWSISWHRLVNTSASTGRYPGIDWSMQGMAGTRKSGVCKELIY